MKNCSTCARFDQNATSREGTGACLSATSVNADRIMGSFGACDDHETVLTTESSSATIGDCA